MGLLIILIVLDAIFLGLTIYGVKKENDWLYCLIPTLGVLLGIFMPLAANQNIDYELFSDKYYSTMYMLKGFENNGIKDENTLLLFADAVEKANEINTKIEKNKRYCKSKWVGIYFSEKIANTPPIVIKVRKQE